MSSPSVVRIAKPDDKMEIWRLCLNHHNENGVFPLAPEKVDFFINRVLYADRIPPNDTGARGVIGVIGPRGSLEAIAFLLLSECWYTRQRHIEELMVYVDAEYRHSDHAKALLQWMRDQSQNTGLPLLSGVMSNHRTEAKCRLYRRAFPKVGELFMLSPMTVALSSGVAAA